MAAMAFASSNDDAVGECPTVDGEYVTLLPHKSDCTKFFQCNEGTPIVKECYPGLHFNPTLLVCDYPDLAGCFEASKGKSICYNQYIKTDLMGFLPCGTCILEDGIGTSKGGWCKF